MKFMSKARPKWFLRDILGNDQYIYSNLKLVDVIVERWGETLDLWGRVRYTEWELVRKIQPGRCGCGSDYRTKNGAIFLGIFPPYLCSEKIEVLKEQLRKPFLCQICFFQKEILKGNWAPKEVYIALGLKIPN